jgi:hypothetical protein
MVRMGHSSSAAALRYQHVMAGRDAAIAAAFGSVGGGERTEQQPTDPVGDPQVPRDPGQGDGGEPEGDPEGGRFAGGVTATLDIDVHTRTTDEPA